MTIARLTVATIARLTVAVSSLSAQRTAASWTGFDGTVSVGSHALGRERSSCSWFAAAVSRSEPVGRAQRGCGVLVEVVLFVLDRGDVAARFV